jgi:hypothetical protein
VQFAEQQRVWKIVDQQNVDSLYQLQAKNYRQDNGSKGIEENTLALVQTLFNQKSAHCFSVDEVVTETGLSKTTTRRYLEHCVEAGFECGNAVRENWASEEDVPPRRSLTQYCRPGKLAPPGKTPGGANAYPAYVSRGFTSTHTHITA